MTEQKKKLSKLCLTGFILSILPLVILGSGIGIILLTDDSGNTGFFASFYVVLATVPLLVLVLSLTGFALSIAGLISAARKDEKGRGFGIAGIVLPSLYAVAVVTLIVMFGVSVVTGIKETKQDRKASDIYHMGSVGTYTNTEYDVSQYRIPEGYELYSPDITVHDSEFRKYAAGKLDTITKENDVFVKGTYQEYAFLIIRRDCYDEWNDPVGYVNYYKDGYAAINYEYEWEVSGFYSCTLDMYKDPSDKYIIITNCDDYKVITEFFEYGTDLPVTDTSNEINDIINDTVETTEDILGHFDSVYADDDY